MQHHDITITIKDIFIDLQDIDINCDVSINDPDMDEPNVLRVSLSSENSTILNTNIFNDSIPMFLDYLDEIKPDLEDFYEINYSYYDQTSKEIKFQKELPNNNRRQLQYRSYFITESYIDDMIVSDDELKRMWNNIEDIFVELKDDRYNISITSYNSTTGLDITLISPRVITSTGFKLSKAPLTYEKISKIVISVQKNNEKIIQRQKDKYKYLTESNWNSDVYKIENDLSDMFVELFDEGYDVLIGHHQDTLTLSIRRDDKQKFNTADVREYFLMAEEYFRDLNKILR